MKQRECEKVLGSMTGANFNKLVNLSKAITDFASGAADEVRAASCLSTGVSCACGSHAGDAALWVVVTASDRADTRVCAGG